MQDMHQRSFGKNLRLQQLLHLKRLEKPDPEFWARFERELQQKQLQALVRPSLCQRARAAVSAPRLTLLAPVSAVAVVCIAIGAAVFSFYTDSARAETAALAGDVQAEVNPAADVADSVADSQREASPSRTDPLFVVDALVPETEKTASEAFRTVALPETFVAGSDSTADYVTNAFTTDFSRQIGSVDAAIEF